MSGNNKFIMSLIATYPKMAEKFVSIAKEMNIEGYYTHASFEEAAKVAQQTAPRIDAILSRGGTARYIAAAVDVPVIIIPITPFDVVQVIHAMDTKVERAALIHYKEEIREISVIEEMYGIRIDQYTFLKHEDIKMAVDDAMEKGITDIIGGHVAVEYAESRGCRGHEVSSGEAAIKSAIVEAVNVITEKEKEKENTARVQSIFESVSDGIVATDEHNDIMLINKSAKKMFPGSQDGRNESLNDSLDTVFKEVQKTGKDKLNILKKIDEKVLLSNYRPVTLDGRTIGAVGIYSDVTLLQKAEKKIRKELAETGLAAKYTLEDIMTGNEGMLEVKELAREYAKTESAILIQGESGTGKELFAQGIHEASQRSSGPFVAVNCAAIDENLMESELFGYEEGAFTGAVKGGKSGLFELAHGGTLFMDEIGEISMSVQTSLLRVLQEKEIRRVGGKGNIPVNVRIISATNKDLNKMIEDGEFRRDLYYRLNVLNIKVPPLRNRKDDLWLLSTHLAAQAGVEIPENILRECSYLFSEYDWPGNIRELSNIIERLAVMYPLFGAIEDKGRIKRLLGIDASKDKGGLQVDLDVEGSLKEIVHRAEKKAIEHFMEIYGNDQDRVAERLDIGKTTLWRKSKGEE